MSVRFLICAIKKSIPRLHFKLMLVKMAKVLSLIRSKTITLPLLTLLHHLGGSLGIEWDGSRAARDSK